MTNGLAYYAENDEKSFITFVPAGSPSARRCSWLYQATLPDKILYARKPEMKQKNFKDRWRSMDGRELVEALLKQLSG